LNLADQYRISQQFDESLRLCRRGTEIARSFDDQPDVGNFLWIMAQVFRDRGDLDNALNTAQESVRVLDPAPSSPGKGSRA
jgi:hypothetical protein